MSFITVFSEDRERRVRLRRVAAEADVDVRTGMWPDEELWSSALLVLVCVAPGFEVPAAQGPRREGVMLMIDAEPDGVVADVDWQAASRLGAQHILVERLVTDVWLRDLFVRATHPQRWSPDQQVGSWQR